MAVDFAAILAMDCSAVNCAMSANGTQARSFDSPLTTRGASASAFVCTVWHEPQGGEMRKIYETFNWEDPGNAAFADRIENPSMDDLAAGEWGAESGYVHVKAGDVVSFQCEFDNPTDTTVTFGDTGSDQMCNIFGFYYPSDGDVWNCVCAGPLCL